MSLDTVVEDIRETARERAEEIRADGEERAAEIVEAAEADAERTRERAREEAESEVEQMRRQKLSSAKLEAKQTRLEARREMLDRVYDAVEAAVAEIDGEDREELTRALLAAGLEEFDEDETVLAYGRESDRDLFDAVLPEYDRVAWGGSRDCLGGVFLEGDASRVSVDNTFDSVLSEVWEENIRTVSERLFEADGDEEVGGDGDGDEAPDEWVDVDEADPGPGDGGTDPDDGP